MSSVPREMARGPRVSSGLRGTLLAPPSLSRGRSVAEDPLGDTRFSFESLNFAVVLCSHAHEDVSNPGEVIAHIGRMLKPSGALIPTVSFVLGKREKPHDCARCISLGALDLLPRGQLEIGEHHKIRVGAAVVFQLAGC